MSYINTITSFPLRRAHLNPLDAMQAVLSATDIKSAWDVMAQNLGEAGFEDCTFAHANRSLKAPMDDSAAQYWANGAASEMIATMMARPDMQRIAPMVQQARKSPNPQAYFGDELRVDETSPLHVEYNDLIQSYNLKARATTPFHRLQNGRMMVFIWWDMKDATKARAHWEEYKSEYVLSTMYFAEAVKDTFQPFATSPDSLSGREKECLLWVASGRRTAEIADILMISDATVNEYLARAMKKLGASTRSQACAKAVVQGLLAP